MSVARTRACWTDCQNIWGPTINIDISANFDVVFRLWISEQSWLVRVGWNAEFRVSETFGRSTDLIYLKLDGASLNSIRRPNYTRHGAMIHHVVRRGINIEEYLYISHKPRNPRECSSYIHQSPGFTGTRQNNRLYILQSCMACAPCVCRPTYIYLLKPVSARQRPP